MQYLCTTFVFNINVGIDSHNRVGPFGKIGFVNSDRAVCVASIKPSKA